MLKIDDPAQLDQAGRIPSIDVINPLDARWGAVGDGVTDDTAAINRAAEAVPAAGGILLLSGHNFAIGGTGPFDAIFIHSNTTVRCESATLTAAGPHPSDMAIIQNVHKNATTLSDHDMRVEGCNFVYPNYLDGRPGKAVTWWFASHTAVINSTFHGGNSATAGIGVLDDEVSGNRAYGSNDPYEHWWGASRVRVVNNYAEIPATTLPYGEFGIEVTGQDTANTPVTADNILIAGNTLYFANKKTGGAPISIDGLAAINHVSILSNHVYVTSPGSVSPCIFYGVPGHDVMIAGNICDGSTVQPSIFINSPAGTASAVNVSSNSLSNCGTSGALNYTANIVLTSMASIVVNNRATGCTGSMVSAPPDARLLGNDDETRVPVRRNQ